MIRKLWQQAILGQEGYILKKLLQKGKILAVIVALIIAAVYYYVTLPAINIHAGSGVASVCTEKSTDAL